MCGCLSHTRYWGPGPQPRHLPWLGIKLATLWFIGQHVIHWATGPKYSPFNAIHQSKQFFHCSTQFLNSSILVLLLFFCFTSSTLAKHFPLRTFFHGGNKNVAQGKVRWIGRVGHGGHAVFAQKLLNTQLSVGRYTFESSPQKFTEAEHSLSQQCQPVPDTDRFLEHSPSGGNLYYKGSIL